MATARGRSRWPFCVPCRPHTRSGLVWLPAYPGTKNRPTTPRTPPTRKPSAQTARRTDRTGATRAGGNGFIVGAPSPRSVTQNHEEASALGYHVGAAYARGALVG